MLETYFSSLKFTNEHLD